MILNADREITTPSDAIAKASRDKVETLTQIHKEAESAIAVALQLPVNSVHKLYCIVLERLSRDAKIRDYLPILVTKKVKYLLHKKLEIRNRNVS